ncbi:twin-arginine translocase TatA/TatE family subunit [bacterium]|nr:twin-arginine translocase TatA/TatE family subunit [candidate division CSSED10-310 bacterium]
MNPNSLARPGIQGYTLDMGWPGTSEILLLLLVVAIVFGARKLPDLGRGLGEGIRNFRKSIKDDSDPDSSDEEPAEKETRSKTTKKID